MCSLANFYKFLAQCTFHYDTTAHPYHNSLLCAFKLSAMYESYSPIFWLKRSRIYTIPGYSSYWRFPSLDLNRVHQIMQPSTMPCIQIFSFPTIVGMIMVVSTAYKSDFVPVKGFFTFHWRYLLHSLHFFQIGFVMCKL